MRKTQGRGQFVQNLAHPLPATVRVGLEAIEVILAWATGLLSFELGSLAEGLAALDRFVERVTDPTDALALERLLQVSQRLEAWALHEITGRRQALVLAGTEERVDPVARLAHLFA